jgi:hypothetical protein
MTIFKGFLLLHSNKTKWALVYEFKSLALSKVGVGMEDKSHGSPKVKST